MDTVDYLFLAATVVLPIAAWGLHGLLANSRTAAHVVAQAHIDDPFAGIDWGIPIIPEDWPGDWTRDNGAVAVEFAAIIRASLTDLAAINVQQVQAELKQRKETKDQ